MTVLPLPPDFDFRQVDILEKTLSANIALAELNGLIVSIPNAEILTQPLVIREAVASSEIENIFTTTLELLEAELFSQDTLPKAQKETLNYKRALIHGFELVKTKGFLATNQIVEIQAQLEPNKSGIRKLPGTVIMNGLGEVVHEPPQEEAQIRALLTNWEQYAHQDDGLDPLIRMAILHYQFESIHPFYDGNGRSGRILMVLHLILSGRLRFPVLFLSGFILKNKQDYYRLLQSVRDHQTWKEWVIYILDAVESQAKETSKKVLQIKELQDQLKENIKKEATSVYKAELVDYLFGQAFYSQSDLSIKFDINRKTAAKYLNQLASIGILDFKKVKKDKLYFCPDFITLLS